MSSKKKNPKLPKEVEEKRTKVHLNIDSPKNTETVDYHSAYASMGFDNSFDLEEFKQNFKINLTSVSDSEAIFDVIGVDPPIANALRRIIISEIPCMAIEHIYMQNNTSIMQDEVLSHRLGLIPIKVDPSDWEFRENPLLSTDRDTITFSLHVKCTRIKDAPDDATPENKYLNHSVYSKDLIWVPAGGQREKYDNIRPVHDDILICKLRPGQEIEFQAHCVKGVGRTHAKWQVVETASYRLLPEVNIKTPITGKDAEKLVETCPMSVFDIEDIGNFPRNFPDFSENIQGKRSKLW